VKARAVEFATVVGASVGSAQLPQRLQP
jgi:hypothetical protein